ncbi:GTP-binding protein [Spirochaeta thermophila DSM 6578]|uniref:GTP-binding protein n=1 Tax=Winmispira thermophila (strain ATCC 700085 / DSM 6578 / Z-1203) TaxID=869211 RepID=G0GE03_WINT7|nr:DUF4416 family protein [Spirochaeta thermophila]AEJ60635.1 GTP-binding protein [Spirochaeta thermophila DSM 6578]
MGLRRSFEPWNLFVGVLLSSEVYALDVQRVLEMEWGPVDFVSDLMPFRYTSYYDKEMGEGILRWFLSFERLVDPSRLWEFKVRSNELEDRWREGGRRRVNLDPGLLNLSRVVLASTKDHAHRIPLQEGIYAEVTLVYREKRFSSLPWTYPDYRSREYQEVFKRMRRLYVEKRRIWLKQVGGEAGG